jgi:hypothetical protein
MANRRRDPEREAFWRSVVLRQVASGLSVRAFCRQQGLAESAFHAWRRTIAERDCKQKATQQRQGTNDRRNAEPKRLAKRPARPSAKQPGEASVQRNGRATRAPAFVLVVVTGKRPQPSDCGTGRDEIVIELAGGRWLRLPGTIAVERLARLVHALEADEAAATASDVRVLRAGAER